LCISGAGIANRWAKLATGSDRTSYEALDRAAATVPPGCEGLQFLPFGNGPERMFEDRELGAHILGLDFNRHRPAHVLRAVQEGIAFAFRYGMDLLSDAGIRPRALRAPRGNLFKSPVFRETLAGASGVAIDLFETDGAEGAARGAAIGARHFASFAEAFRSLERPETVEPADSFRVEPFYRAWLESLEALLAAAKP
jgi:xylulokinase